MEQEITTTQLPEDYPRLNKELLPSIANLAEVIRLFAPIISWVDG
jgi:hypothetical protein